MPDYGIIKPLCQELGITVSELIDGEVKADSSIRVFDEEQILDMLGRIQQLEKTEKEINRLEDRLKELSALAEANNSDYSKLMEIEAQREELRQRLDRLYSEWMLLSDN